MYTHVRDRWGIFYDQPILLNERQAGAAIEGVIRQGGSEDVAQLAVDTHGFTDFAMSLSRLVGFVLCATVPPARQTLNVGAVEFNSSGNPTPYWNFCSVV
ncbi:protein of unknown function (plasmid) [Cupriavidus taiwanensis]|uniref:Tn3 transposase DDE domain-containing protein n=1 Tax=Cupriavidus taiwanensis TaxID=164546 RepID=A0A7Z7NQK6_9BURK|nr:hypothetical protein CBM2597_U60019 [Cupriavidus taiwanensis]SOZ97289.1 hypothetical protein CBM2598_U60012 [Cupriavidus taiwanensis]SPC26178.1 hypothetical protein CBM2594_U70011 [Cupriavidus taiwanensis]SPD37690.1 protein of unknown function [Cupriavidus taiwanensis]